jgi:sulfate adenylyltransferase subunit 1
MSTIADTTQVRIATIGSVDDGKSTLIGRLLHDSKGIFEDQLNAVSSASKRYGDGSMNLALLTDGLRAEREQGITIDVAYRYFATPRRSFVLADTPGHAQFTRNMVTGASVSDIAIVLVDARHGVVEQTRRHVAIAALLGVSHLILAVNKMDLVEWTESSFQSVVAGVQDILKTLSSTVPLHPIPVSATNGDNVVELSPRSPWYTGPSVLDLIETLDVSEANEVGGRLPVQWTLRVYGGSDYRAFAGQLTGGDVHVGDAVTVLPKGQKSVVQSITRSGDPVDVAIPGDAIALELADALDVGRGDVLVVDGGVLPTCATRISVDVCWFAETDIRVGDRIVLRHSARDVPAVVSGIDHILDLDTLTNVQADKLTLNDIGRISLDIDEPIVVDAYADSKVGGSLIAVDPVSNATVGALLVRSAQ